MAKSKKFPEVLFGIRENEGAEDEFLNTTENIDDISVQCESLPVAIYKLAEVKTVVNKTEIV